MKNLEGGLYQEELFGTAGFVGMSSLIYHVHPPTVVSEVRKVKDLTAKIGIEKNMKALSFKGFSLPQIDDYIESRKILFVNNDLKIGLAAPKSFSKDYFYRNSDSDEMLFIHVGSGKLRTMYGSIDFKYGDYLIIPRGTTYQIDFDSEDNRILFIESASAITTPKRYRNNYGQLLEHSPFCERDIRLPKDLKTHDEKGQFKVFLKNKMFFGNIRMKTTLLMSLAGMDLIILMHFRYMILSQLQVVFTCLLRSTRPGKLQALLYVRLCQECMIITPNRYHLLITIVILIRRNYYIM